MLGLQVGHHWLKRETSRTLVMKIITCNYFCFQELISEDYINNYILESLAELILEKCNSFLVKPSDYNYISEVQEEFNLHKLHLQVHFLIRQEFQL